MVRLWSVVLVALFGLACGAGLVSGSCSYQGSTGSCRLSANCDRGSNTWVATGQCPGATGSPTEQRCCLSGGSGGGGSSGGESCSAGSVAGTCTVTTSCDRSTHSFMATGQCPGNQYCCVPKGSGPSAPVSPPSNGGGGSDNGCALRVVSGFSNIKERDASGRAIYINKVFMDGIAALNRAAKEAGVTILITSSYRWPGYVVNGAVYPAASNSWHKAGMAVDINVISASGTCGNSCLRGGGQSKFINLAKQYGASTSPPMKWGASFGDYVHFDARDDSYSSHVSEMTSSWNQQSKCVQNALSASGNFRSGEEADAPFPVDPAEIDPEDMESYDVGPDGQAFPGEGADLQGGAGSGSGVSGENAGNSSSSALSTGAIAGIVIGVILFVLLLLAVGIFFVVRVLRAERSEASAGVDIRMSRRSAVGGIRVRSNTSRSRSNTSRSRSNTARGL